MDTEKPTFPIYRSQNFLNNILDIEKELEFVYKEELGDLKTELVEIEFGQVDYLFDLYLQIENEEEIGLTNEEIGELEREIDIVWENDLQIDFRIFDRSINKVTQPRKYYIKSIHVAVLDVYRGTISLLINAETEKYFTENLKEVVLRWKEMIYKL